MRLRMTHSMLLFTAVLGAGIAVRVQAAPQAQVRAASATTQVARGEYLVRIMGCHDCHTPHKLGPKGAEPDMSRALTGHPSAMTVTPLKPLPEPWVWTGAGTNTAFNGPWGVSFTANLTPDKETGLGDWTFDMFAQTMKTGRHQGKGRPLLPPMPFSVVANLTESDMRALFAYLQSLPPVQNKVPSPIDPPEEQQ